MKTELIKIEQIKINGANPRTITNDKFDKLINSILVLPKMLELRPIVVDDTFIALGGNMRYRALTAIESMSIDELAQRLSGLRDYNKKTEAERQHLIAYWDEWKANPTAPIIKASELSEDERREFVIKDNASFGSWDMDALANEWDSQDLDDWGLDVWQDNRDWEKKGLTTKDRETNEGYDAFTDKFKPKLTTDDCYTPPDVYDVVIDFVNEKIRPINKDKVIRPFKPGADYRNEYYPDGCIVIDNPPFSILSEILDFYIERGINFFLFGPALTLFCNKDCTFIFTGESITYENGAKVATGFISNMCGDIKVWMAPEFGKRIAEVQKREVDTFEKYILPNTVITSARVNGMAKNGVEIKLPLKSCRYISNLDGMREIGKGLYGGGFLILEKAAEKIAEKAAEKAAEKIAEKAAEKATEILLSARELEIIKSLE